MVLVTEGLVILSIQIYALACMCPDLCNSTMQSLNNLLLESIIVIFNVNNSKYFVICLVFYNSPIATLS